MDSAANDIGENIATSAGLLPHPSQRLPDPMQYKQRGQQAGYGSTGLNLPKMNFPPLLNAKREELKTNYDDFHLEDEKRDCHYIEERWNF